MRPEGAYARDGLEPRLHSLACGRQAPSPPSRTGIRARIPAMPFWTLRDRVLPQAEIAFTANRAQQCSSSMVRQEQLHQRWSGRVRAGAVCSGHRTAEPEDDGWAISPPCAVAYSQTGPACASAQVPPSHWRPAIHVLSVAVVSQASPSLPSRTHLPDRQLV